MTKEIDAAAEAMLNAQHVDVVPALSALLRKSTLGRS